MIKTREEQKHFFHIPNCWGPESFPSPASVAAFSQVMILSQDRHLVARELEFPQTLFLGEILSLPHLPFLFLHTYLFVYFKEDESKILKLILIYVLHFLWS